MTADQPRSGERPLRELVEFLGEIYRRFVPALFVEADAELVRAGDRARPARAALAMLRDDLTAHLQKEETVLFPWLLSARAATAGPAIRDAQLEHRDLLDAFAGVVRLAAIATGGVGCASLDPLERALRARIEFEDEVLFPRALAAS